MSGAVRSSLYKAKYGAWAGQPSGREPDYTRCCEQIFPGSGQLHYQCQRPRGHGPDGAYCKQHDPAAAKARTEASGARSREKWNRERYRWSGPSFFAALVKIAEGHNDARGLAQQVIDDFKAGEHKPAVANPSQPTSHSPVHNPATK